MNREVNSAILSRYSRVHSLPSSLRNFLTATVKLLDRWEEYSLETNCGEPEGYGAARAVVHAEFSVLKQTDKGDVENERNYL